MPDFFVIRKEYAVGGYSSSHKIPFLITVIYRVEECVINGKQLAAGTYETVVTGACDIIDRSRKVGFHLVIHAVAGIINSEYGVCNVHIEFMERTERTIGHGLHNGISSRSVTERTVRQEILTRRIVFYYVYAFVYAVAVCFSVIRISCKAELLGKIDIAGVEVYIVAFSDAGNVGIAG